METNFIALVPRLNIEFLIAPSARERIGWLVDEFKRKKGKSDVIPAVMWIDAEENRNIEVSSPAIGFYDNRAEIANEISVVGDFEFVLAIPSEYEPIFDGKVLHYLSGSFRLEVDLLRLGAEAALKVNSMNPISQVFEYRFLNTPILVSSASAHLLRKLPRS
jgi:hypothetical protein